MKWWSWVGGTGWGNQELTGIEFLAIGLECAPVMDVDGVALLGFPLALDGKRDIDLQIVRCQGANSSRGEQRKRQEEVLHVGRR